MSDIAQTATNIHRLSSVLGRIADRKLQDTYGLGMSQFKILWMLNKHKEGVLQTTIATWLSQTEAAISRQIGLLKDDHLIEKRADPKNKRNHIIVLTSSGKKFAEDAMQVLVKEYKPFFAAITIDERRALNEILEKVFNVACTALPDYSVTKGQSWKK